MAKHCSLVRILQNLPLIHDRCLYCAYRQKFEPVQEGCMKIMITRHFFCTRNRNQCYRLSVLYNSGMQNTASFSRLGTLLVFSALLTSRGLSLSLYQKMVFHVIQPNTSKDTTYFTNKCGFFSFWQIIHHTTKRTKMNQRITQTERFMLPYFTQPYIGRMAR